MKIRRAIVCGAAFLMACALGNVAHASSKIQNLYPQSRVVSQIKQSNYQSKPTQGQMSSKSSSIRIIHNSRNNRSYRQDNWRRNIQSVRPRQNNQVRRMQRVNYYTRIAQPRRYRRGYAIYANPSDTINVKPLGYQYQLSNQAIHVSREAMVNNHRWIKFRSRISGWIDSNGINRHTRWFYVPLISQRPQLPSGCEITATTMMLKHLVGNRVNKMKLAREMPRSSNPNYGFVGSPYSSSGWWIAPRGLMHLVNHYTHGKALNMTGASKQSFINQINKGIPVVMWVGNMDGFPNHALTVYGYNKRDFMYNDPWLDARVTKNMNYLWAHHANDPLVRYGALSYRK